MLELYIITHYQKDDPEFDSDYTEMEILDSQGNVLEQYGDSYHDRSKSQVHGFITAVMWLKGPENVKLTYVNIADTEY